MSNDNTSKTAPKNTKTSEEQNEIRRQKKAARRHSPRGIARPGTSFTSGRRDDLRKERATQARVRHAAAALQTDAYRSLKDGTPAEEFARTVLGLWPNVEVPEGTSRTRVAVDEAKRELGIDPSVPHSKAIGLGIARVYTALSEGLASVRQEQNDRSLVLV